ncbi:DNA polymerase [Megasphaera sp.]|uniref:DNA polymerase n=1 Tax=Megasphaera sp. TaxID=2023260 RepID=UPI004025F95D
MRTLAIDLETYSSNDIKYSVYKYVEAPDFEILLFAYAFDDDPVRVVDLAQDETLPDDVKAALYDKNVLKTAFNANFEINCLKKYFPDLPEEQWECDRILSLYNSYPPHLAAVAKAMHFDEDRQKDTRGKALIRYFCLPCKPTKANGGRTRNYPKDAPDKWEIFKEYNRQDVVVERAIRDKLVNLRPPDFEHENWLIDQDINRNGIMVNRQLVDNAIRLSGEYREKLLARAQDITGLDNPNSPLQVKGWLEERLGRTVDSLSKAAVADMLAEDIPSDVREMLSIRQKISKSSIKKYDAMRMAACQDSRIRGMFQFYGAARTGRFAGRIVQLQNLPRNSMPDLDLARSMVLDGDLEALEMCYDDVQDVLSQLIRTALEAPPGKRFIVADFSAIEARVIAWLAGEEWEMKAFAEGKDIYCATASAMFGVPVVKHGVNGELRQKGKVATLACGYGGGIGALKAMGADKMGLTDDELQTVVRKWRDASPHIVKLWANVENAAMNAVSGIPVTIKQHGLHFHVEDDALYIELPSGRHLVYLHPHLGQNRFGSDAILYTGLGGSKTTAGRWGTLETYGGKLVENCMAQGTLVLTDRGLIPIEKVSKDMLIWDGISFVRHEGVIHKGLQDCITVDGLSMTPDHRILTEKGWIPCVKTQGLNWADVRLPHRHQASRKHERGETEMAVPLRLRPPEKSGRIRPEKEKASYKVMRLHERAFDWPRRNHPRVVAPPHLGGMALIKTAMPEPACASLQELRGPRHNGLQTLARKFPEFPGRYGAIIQARTPVRPDRLQQRLFAGKLSLGYTKGKRQEQADKSSRAVLRQDDKRTSRRVGNRRDNAMLSTGPQLASGIIINKTKCKKRVYDIRNCGPRHRFAVYDPKTKKVRLVHNCVQAIARDCLCAAMKRLTDAGYKICAHIHDEVILEMPEGKGSLDDAVRIMCQNETWNEGLVMNADGFEAKYYQKD